MSTQDELLAAVADDSTDEYDFQPHQTFGPYAMRKDGLYVNRVGGGSEKKIVSERICDPFEVVARCRDPDGSKWGKPIKFKDADGAARVTFVSDAELHGPARDVAAKLADDGLGIDLKYQTHLADYLNKVNPPMRVMLAARTGWHQVGDETVFVMPEKTIGPTTPAKTATGSAAGDGGETVMLSHPGALKLYAVKGSLEDWQAGVGALSKGQSQLMLAISASFAGPLLHLVNAEGGGLHFHGQSSTGKSTLLAAAASVWGRGGTPGYVGSWRATANGLEARAAACNDSLMALDELGVVNATEAALVAYSLSNGAGKQRSGQTGAAQRTHDYRVMALSTGEVTLAAKLAENRGSRPKAGQAVRMIDVAADRGKLLGVFDSPGEFTDARKFADAIKKASVEAYGSAGPAFVQRLIDEGIEGITDIARLSIEKFVARYLPVRSSEQVARVAMKFGLIAAAGELAVAFGVVPWEKGEARRAAALAYKTWISARGGNGSHESKEAIEQVRYCITQHGASRFEPRPASAQVMVPNIPERPIRDRLGWTEVRYGRQLWHFAPETWKREVCQGLDPAAVARTLADSGMLIRPKTRSGLQRRVRINGLPMWVYTVSDAIMQ